MLGARRDDQWIELDFPSLPPIAGDVPDEIVEMIGGTPVVRARGNVGGGMSGYFLEYETEEEVRGLQADFSRLADVPDGYVLVTAPASMDGYDFVSRFFAPPAGIDEDPVTGSAHCTLGPWWSDEARQGLAARVPMLGPRWNGSRSSGGRSCAARGPGRDRAARRARLAQRVTIEIRVLQRAAE